MGGAVNPAPNWQGNVRTIAQLIGLIGKPPSPLI